MTEWTQRPACAGINPEVFFPDSNDQAGIRRAQRYCNNCPVRAQCLTLAMSIGAEFGIFGGTTPAWRKANGAARWKSPAAQTGENNPHGTEARRQWERRQGITECRKCYALGPGGQTDYERLTAPRRKQEA